VSRRDAWVFDSTAGSSRLPLLAEKGGGVPASPCPLEAGPPRSAPRRRRAGGRSAPSRRRALVVPRARLEAAVAPGASAGARAGATPRAGGPQWVSRARREAADSVAGDRGGRRARRVSGPLRGRRRSRGTEPRLRRRAVRTRRRGQRGCARPPAHGGWGRDAYHRPRGPRAGSGEDNRRRGTGSWAAFAERSTGRFIILLVSFVPPLGRGAARAPRARPALPG
jgi:hypothetical protein